MGNPIASGGAATKHGGMQPLLCLVYVSTARPDFGGPAVAAMVERAGESNAAAGITGCLLHFDGSLMQYLEGPPDAVVQLYRRILADPRHHDAVELHRGPQTGRVFPDWSMQLAQPGERLWNELYQMTPREAGQLAGPPLRPLFTSFLISGDRSLTFRT